MKNVVTGGPCTGKTTLLEELARRGCRTAPEAARAVIEAEQLKEKQQPGYSGVLPWNDLYGFQHAVLEQQLELEASEPDFLDRSLVDSIAYAELGSIGLPKEYYPAIEQAQYATVFFLEALPTYNVDSARIEAHEQAQRIHKRLHNVYERLGYHVVRVPAFPGSVSESTVQRVDYVFAHLRTAEGMELEGKYCIDDVAGLEERLNDFPMVKERCSLQHDTYHIDEQTATLYRVREEQSGFLFTQKGVGSGGDLLARSEYNRALSLEEATQLRRAPCEGIVEKMRTEYRPVFDPSTCIAIDRVNGLDSWYVEIESRSAHQVLQWKQRLGIEGDSSLLSYRELVANAFSS